MELCDLNRYYDRFKYGEDNFHNLMKFRVRKILLISTIYDAYIFEHDSKLSEQIVGEYHQLNLTTVPQLIRVSTGKEALHILSSEKIDLVITTMRIGSINPFQLGKKIKEIRPDLAVLLLLTVKADNLLLNKYKKEWKNINRVFLWNGDSKIFLVMIKYVEDMVNAPFDTEHGFVRVIVLVEDSINFYSLYLPLLYTEIMEQTQRLIADELNDVNKYFRMRTRPKVLLVSSYEEAWNICRIYGDNIIGIISDIEFTLNGKKNDRAGFILLDELRKTGCDVPFLLQSSDLNKREESENCKTQFLYKKSHSLLKELHEFILSSLGFGDFVFKDETGFEYTSAHNIEDFEMILPTIPMKSLLYHGERNHFSSWLTSHGEFKIARRVKKIRTDDFEEPDKLRQFLIALFKEAREERNRGKIINFEKGHLDQKDVIIRIGTGSLGGKGRGLAFFNAIISTINPEWDFPEASISIPKTAIICTSEYDHYMIDNNLPVNGMEDLTDIEIKQLFLNGQISIKLKEQLKELLDIFTFPLAVRSSSLLEDSLSQPFSGVYQTYMLPNSSDSIEERLKYLLNAVKLVFASIYLKSALNYIEGLSYNIEEEKMAVIIQRVIGQQFDTRFYPHFSGVAQSYNFYPIKGMKPKDGIAELAVGLGHTVVGGGKGFVFCPIRPEISFCTERESFQASQTEFYVLNMSEIEPDLLSGENATLNLLTIDQAESDGVLKHLSSVWDYENNRITDDLYTAGPKVINFNNILKYNYFPLSKILREILDICEKSLGSPVEIEYAVDLHQTIDKNPTLYLLQVRPLLSHKDDYNINISEIDYDDIWLYAENSLGNGMIKGIRNILQIREDVFDKGKTREIGREIHQFNKLMKHKNEQYILIGPGRWGSRDPFLGIPVTWAQISQSKVIIETGIPEFDIEPSQGSHFFHNLVAMNIGYFHIPFFMNGNSFLDKEWLKMQKKTCIGNYLFHIELESSVEVLMDGKKGVSIITRNRRRKL